MNWWEKCAPVEAQATLLKQLESESYDKLAQPSAPLHVNVSYVVHDIIQVHNPETATLPPSKRKLGADRRRWREVP